MTDDRKTRDDDDLHVVPLNVGGPAGAKKQLRSKAVEDPESVEEGAARAERASQSSGYPSARHVSRADRARAATATQSRKRNPRVNFPLPDYVFQQLRQNVMDRNEKSLKSYILRFLAEHGEIEIDPADVEDQRGVWMQKMMAERRGERDD